MAVFHKVCFFVVGREDGLIALEAEGYDPSVWVLLAIRQQARFLL
jgi:hypothetical protein